MFYFVVGYWKCCDLVIGKFFDCSFDIIGIMVYIVLDNEIFYMVDDVEFIFYYEF